MCNEIALRISLDLLRDDFADLRVPLRFPEALPNLPPRPSIRITDRTLIVRQGGEAAVRRWSWPGPGGRPVYNLRSDGRSFGETATIGRCLIPADAFFEFTDPPADAPRRIKKTKWRFTVAGADWFCIAGLWRRDPAGVEAFTLLTCPPGPDIARYHNRQIVLPPRAQWAGWLDGSLPAATVCRPAPAGMLAVEPA